MSPQRTGYDLGPLDRRLRAAQKDRIALWVAVLVLFFLVGWIAMQVHNDQISGCERGSEAALRQEKVAKHLGYREDAREAHQRSLLDCGEAYSWF